MSNNVSTLGLNLGVVDRTKTIQDKMATLQQQVSTGVKYQTFAEYGSSSKRIQEYRASLQSIDVYMQNIDLASVNIKQMDAAISETTTQATKVLSAITIQLQKGSEFDMKSISDAAAAALQLVQANMNARVGDRYLLAGTDVSNQPYAGASTATTNLQAQVADWLDGTTADTATFLSNLDGLTDSQLGYSLSVQTSKNVFARADDTLEVDYTVKANDEGFRKIVMGLNALANLTEPTTGDTPTADELQDVINSLYTTIQQGVQDLRDSSTKISSASAVLEDIRQTHLQDEQSFQLTLEQTEATDTASAIVSFQSLSTQLEASFRITSILSQLSLTNYLS